MTFSASLGIGFGIFHVQRNERLNLFPVVIQGTLADPNFPPFRYSYIETPGKLKTRDEIHLDIPIAKQ